MKKRITDNTCDHDFEINQIVKVDRIYNDGTYKSNGWYFGNDDCEDFDDYKPGDKVRVAKDTYNHKQKGNLVTITNLTEGYCADGSRSYMTEEGMFIPERDFDCYEGETYVNQKETTTMKYKEGDIVKIVARKHGHGFEIGTIVTIVKIYRPGKDSENYDAADGEQTWGVVKEEIEPANNITTRPHDYTGCDPEIAEVLKQGLEVYCEVWDSKDLGRHNTKGWISSYRAEADYPYLAIHHWKYARPIRQDSTQEEPAQKAAQEPQPKTKLVPKPASEIFAWLENPENGYYKDSDGDYYTYSDEPSFIVPDMIKHCGTDDCGDWEWHPEWLREVPVEVPVETPTSPEPAQEPVSETSENPTQYSIGDIVEVTGYSYYHSFNTGDIVEIVAYDRLDDNYRCKRQSDDKFQWLRTCNFKLVRSKPRTATVIHKSSCQLLPGQKVTVIKRNEAGNFLCESDTGSHIWMQPYQLKFD